MWKLIWALCYQKTVIFINPAPYYVPHSSTWQVRLAVCDHETHGDTCAPGTKPFPFWLKLLTRRFLSPLRADTAPPPHPPTPPATPSSSHGWLAEIWVLCPVKPPRCWENHFLWFGLTETSAECKPFTCKSPTCTSITRESIIKSLTCKSPPVS